MKEKIILLSIISLDVLVLLFQISSISISGHEADLLYGQYSAIQVLENFSLSIFGHSDIALRLPMMLFHILSVLLLHDISKQYLPNLRNRVWLLVIFILLPGVFSSALIVDSAGFLIFGLLLFIYVYKKFSINYTYPILILMSTFDGYFVYLFISLIFFSYHVKNKFYFVFNILLLSLSLYMYGIDASGSPKGHFLDVIGIYSAIFTPVIFIYIFYVLYKNLLSKNIEIIWFISAIPLVISLLLSFRQNINVEEFAPYLLMSLPIVAQTFYSSYRVRLKQFRRGYKTIFILSGLFLLVNFFVVMLNKELYLFIDNPKKHFARKMHVAKELAQELKIRDINCVTSDNSMSQRLRFYSITDCANNILYEQPLNNDYNNVVTISYKYRPIYKAIVTNINNQ